MLIPASVRPWTRAVDPQARSGARSVLVRSGAADLRRWDTCPAPASTRTPRTSPPCSTPWPHRYDRTNDVISLGQDRAWRKATLKAVDAQPGETVLDLAAGTGTSSEPMADAGVRVVACDLSVGMLEVGKRRRPDLAFVAGDALHLPFADESFDAVTMSFGLRNVNDVDARAGRALRVTKPGGRLVVCEFSRPTFKPFRAVYTELPHAGAAARRAGRLQGARRLRVPRRVDPRVARPARPRPADQGTPAGPTWRSATSPAASSPCTAPPARPEPPPPEQRTRCG